MKVSELMNPDVLACRATDPVEQAVQLMWERDCGCVPVVDARERVVGMLTDRDACMAAVTSGTRLDRIPVATVMSGGAASCLQDEEVSAALRTMAEWQVRRLPVVDEEARLVGLVSLADIAQWGGTLEPEARRACAEEVLGTLTAITCPRADFRHAGETANLAQAGASAT